MVTGGMSNFALLFTGYGPGGSRAWTRGALVDAHLFGEHADEGVATGGGDQRQAHPGVARGRLDHRRPRREDAAGLGVVDDEEGEAVFDASAGAEMLALREDGSR